MYTEEDEKIKVKKDNSNTKESDFYTAFNNDKEDKKPKKGKKKTTKEKEVAVKTEEDFDDFYSVSPSDEEIEEEDAGKKNKVKLIIVGILLIVLIIAIVLLLVFTNKPKGDIELSEATISLDVGQKGNISYKVVNTDKTVTPTFSSSDESVAIVNENGEITAIGTGEATITINYTIGNTTKEKTCIVKVQGSGSVDRNVTLNLKIENGKDNTWTSKDVTVNPEASSIYGIESIKYAINCDSDCEYKDITNNKITITSSGVTKVKVVATDKKKQTVTKEVTIKIDKDAPSVKLNSGTNIVSTQDVEVCATCSDSLSGCKQSKVCKKYTSTKSNQTITVEDAAGNKATSQAFSVTINKVTAPCILSVSADGTVTATLRVEASYYGFNSNYTGNNEKSKKISFTLPANVESGATGIIYYVKDTNGTAGRCSMTVYQVCKCANNTSGDNCTRECTFSSVAPK